MDYDEYARIISHLFTRSVSGKKKSLEKPVFLAATHDISVFSEGVFSAVNFPFKVSENGFTALTSSPDVYSKEQVVLGCAGIDPSQIFLFLDIDSTNTYLKTLSNGLTGFAVCIAEQQTEGRGRRGKSWVSPFGANLYFSVRTKVLMTPRFSGGISLVVGLAIVKALEKLGFNGLMIKWPNDIYANGQKLGGILIEVVSLSHDSIEVVIGVGLNVNMPVCDAKNIDQPWVDLSGLLSENSRLDALPSRTDILVALINQIRCNLGLLEDNGLKSFYSEWGGYDLLFGREVEIKRENDVIYRTAVGVNELGELLVKEEGEITAINSGDVSVRHN